VRPHSLTKGTNRLGERLGLLGLDRLLADDPRPWSRCRRPWTSSYVTAHGKVLPCCIAPFAHQDFQGMVLGDLKEHSLDEIWNGETYQHFRERLQGDDPHPCCRTCGVGWSL